MAKGLEESIRRILREPHGEPKVVGPPIVAPTWPPPGGFPFRDEPDPWFKKGHCARCSLCKGGRPVKLKEGEVDEYRRSRWSVQDWDWMGGLWRANRWGRNISGTIWCDVYERPENPGRHEFFLYRHCCHCVFAGEDVQAASWPEARSEINRQVSLALVR